jgi:hypothetical protein
MKAYPIKISSASDVNALARATAAALKEAEETVQRDINDQKIAGCDSDSIYKIDLWPAYWNENGEPKRSFGLKATTTRRIR